MKHQTTENGPALVVALQGEVDLQTSPEARQVLLSAVAQARPVLVDLSGVAYIDSSGVASLVEALQTARKSGQELMLAAVSEGAMRVLKLARLEQVFPIHPTLDEALAALG